MMNFKSYFLVFFIFCFCSPAKAQTLKQFNGHLSITEVTFMGLGNYNIKGFYTDPASVFTALDAKAGDRIIDLSGSTFEILTITLNGSELTTSTKALDNADPKLGVGIIYRPSEKGYPLISLETPGNVLFNALNTATLSIDASIPSYVIGASLPVISAKDGDIILLTTDAKLYKLNGASWEQYPEANISISYANPVTSTPDGNIGDAIKSYWDDKYYIYNGITWIAPNELSALPNTAKFGDVFFDTGQAKLFMFSDGKWLNISSSSIPGGPGVELPTNSKPGDMFFNTDENVLYVYDNTGQWLEVSVNGSVPKGPVNPDPIASSIREGSLFYNTSDHRLFVYNGANWVPVENTLKNGHIFVGNTSNIAVSVPLSGDATISATGKLTIKDLAVTDEKLDKSNIPLSGFGNPMDNISMGDGTTNFKIVNLGSPSISSDAATKGYVDALLTNPALLALSNEHMFMGNTSNKAVAVNKNMIPISGFSKAIAHISMGTGVTGGNFKITNMADPSHAQDAATKNYVDTRVINPTTLSLTTGSMFVGGDLNTAVVTPKNMIPLSGFGAAVADVSMGTFKLNNLAAPTADHDAANKKYVDDKIISPSNLSLNTGNLFVGDANGKAADVQKNTIPLSGFAAAVANISIGGFLLNDLANPIADTDASTKKYVDDLFMNPSDLLSLPKDNMFLGDVNGKALATPKKNIAISGFAKAVDNIYMGDAAQRFNISELADPVFEQDAATKSYVDAKASTPGSLDLPTDHILVGDANNKAKAIAKNVIPFSDFAGATADVQMGDGTANFKISNLTDPVADQDAATKKYVDASITAATSSIPVGKDNLGNHMATENLKLSVFSVSNKGGDGEGLSFDTQGNASFGQDVTVNGNFNTPSDRNLKTQIETLTSVLQKIDQIRGVSFVYKDQRKYATGIKIGVIAQELKEVYPAMVTKGADGFLKVDYTQLTGMLIQAVKEQQKEIDTLKTRLDQQQEQINSILRKMK